MAADELDQWRTDRKLLGAYRSGEAWAIRKVQQLTKQEDRVLRLVEIPADRRTGEMPAGICAIEFH